jgi:hypothetical protein
MTDSAVRRRFGSLPAGLSPVAVGLATAVVLAELALLVGYVGITGAELTDVRYLLYPFVWIDLGMWAVLTTRPTRAPARVQAAVGVAAVGYLLVLALAGGLLELAHVGHFHSHGAASGLSVFTALPPGWGPTVVYEHAAFTLTLVPYKLVGYLALTYLVYTALLDTVTAALSGAVGLLSCVSCSWPVFASLVAGFLGGSTVASAVYSLSVDLSTTAFVAAVLLLVWRPGVSETS